jgi:leucyl-tRNA synthetase
MNKTIKEVSASMEQLAIRNAINEIIQFTSEFSKYINEGVNNTIHNDCKTKLALILHPFVPHLTEEVWEVFGNKKFLSLSDWPLYEKSLLTVENEYKWKLINNTLDSINHIILIIKKEKLKNITIIIAASWKYNFMSELIAALEETKEQKAVMATLMKNEQFKKHGNFVSQTVGKVMKNLGKYSISPLTNLEEFKFFKELEEIFEKKYKCEINIIKEEKSKEKKAFQSLPGRPAIIIS